MYNKISNSWKIFKENVLLIYRVRHIKCYRAIALKLLIISKNVSDKSLSVREGGHTGRCYRHYATLWQNPRKINRVMLDLAIEVVKLQSRLVLSTFRHKSHSSLVLNTEHNRVVHRRVAFTCSCKHARARLPLIEAVRFAKTSRKLAQSSDLQKNMDQWRDRRQCRTNN